jgi:hypothetical protein
MERQKWKKEYRIYEIILPNHRKLHLLEIPFFGQGQTSYDAILVAAKKVNPFLY